MDHRLPDTEIVRNLDQEPGLSMRALARRTGISHETIRQAWHRAHPGQTRTYKNHHEEPRTSPQEMVSRLETNPDLSMKDLARELGTAILTVRQAWQAHHPGSRRQPHRRPRPSDQEIVHLMELNLNIPNNALAKQMGISPMTVGRAWNRAHPEDTRTRKYQKPTQQERDHIVRRLDADPNLSKNALASEMSLDIATVRKTWSQAHPGETRPSPQTHQATARRAEIVRRLESNPELSIRDLATRMGLTQPTIRKAWNTIRPKDSNTNIMGNNTHPKKV